jgi:tryptophanyl-tRNA synthetase
MEKIYSEYLDEECSRIKKELLGDLHKLFRPLKNEFDKIEQDINRIEKLISYENIYKIISKQK